MDKATTALHLVIEAGFRVGMWIFFLWLDARAPYVRHIDEDELWYYRYPSMESYVPKTWMYVIVVLTPCLIFFIQYITHKDDKSTIPSIISCIFGLTLAFCMLGVIVATLKLTVGRPRPNFYLRCFPEGYGTDIDNCDGEYMGQMDGRKGFPSAHASFSFCCMTYMCLYIYKVYDMKKPRFLKGVIMTGMFSLILIATLIAVSRTMDYHNHFFDVLAGIILGSAFAWICFKTYSNRDEVLDENLRKILSRQK